jgi:hypothetical protein
VSEYFREVLDCGSPLPLFHRGLVTQSGRGLPQSKTLTRGSLTPGQLFRYSIFKTALKSSLAYARCFAINFRMLVIFRMVAVGSFSDLISGSVQTFDSWVRVRQSQ